MTADVVTFPGAEGPDLETLCDKQRVAFGALDANPCYDTALAYVQATDAFNAASAESDGVA